MLFSSSLLQRQVAHSLSPGKERPGDETDGEPAQTGEHTCPDCAGTGVRDGAPCGTCRGSGVVRVTVGDA